MLTYTVRRLLYSIVTFFGITIATFVLIHSVPGDPISFFAGSRGSGQVSQRVLENIRRRHHLDRPLPVQYVYWLRGVMTLDFGESISERRPVRNRIAEKLPNTLILNSLAFLLAAAIGYPSVSGAERERPFSRPRVAISSFSVLTAHVWVALMLRSGSPSARNPSALGMRSRLRGDEQGSALPHVMRHMILPVITLTYAQLRSSRDSRARHLPRAQADFITTARARGSAGRRRVATGVRNALLPLITLLGLTIPYFCRQCHRRVDLAWDGVGRLYLDSITPATIDDHGLTVVSAIVTLLAASLPTSLRCG